MTWEDLFPWVLPLLPTCPRATLRHHLRMAAIKFCAESMVWTEELDPILADGQAECSLNMDSEVEMVRLLAVEAGRKYDVVEASIGRARLRRDDADGIAFTFNRQEVQLHPAPKAGTSVIVEVALKPSMTSTEFSDDVGAHHAEDIAHGALSSLFAMPKQDWSDTDLAGYHGTLFERAIRDANVQSFLGFGDADMRVESHPF